VFSQALCTVLNY